MIKGRAWGAGQPWTDWTKRGVVSMFPGEAGLQASLGRDSNSATTGKGAGSLPPLRQTEQDAGEGPVPPVM